MLNNQPQPNPNHPASSGLTIDAPGGQFGVVGDNAHIEDGIHYYTITNLPPPPQDEQARRNREAMLTLVENTWIKGVLEKSLHGALLTLDLKETPGAVQRPYDARLRQAGWSEELLPHDTHLGPVFERLGGALLILGQPGAGKTTMLLDLARDLIARARDNERQPIPVVLSLSSWESQYQTLEAWLLEELQRQYSVGKRIAAPWLAQNHLCLLLDGLDEVAEEEQRHCVAAINTYREAHGPSLQLAVCSRTEEYEALTEPLHLPSAVALQPLTGQQIEAYLDGAGIELQAVRRTLHTDPTLRELAETPLLLSLMTAAYQGKSLAELQTLTTPEARRAHIFETYIAEAIQRRPSETYTPEQTRLWLTWLAKKMRDNSLSTFFIEGMQPAWLSTAHQRWGYGLVVRLMGGMTFILANGLGVLAAWILRSILMGEAPPPEVSSQIIIVLIFGLVSGLAFVLSSLIALRTPAFVAVLVATGLIIGVGSLFNPGVSLVAGVLFGIPGSLAGVTLANPIKINIDELVYWSWPRAFLALALGLIFGMGLAYLLDAVDLADGLAIGLLLGLGVMLAFGSQRVPMTEETLTPDKKLRYLRVQAGRAGLLVTLGCLLLGVPIGILGEGMLDSISFALIFGIPFILTATFLFGGTAYVQHLLLRLALWFQKETCLHVVDFLDYAAECILLHKVGGGYSFRHRLLLEHFSQNNSLGGKKWS